ncbi:MAG TPA: cell division ATP-binding protein FtsE [bacterium]|nr:MAG: Cell division ATP-binding protein FtsE [bacterium ADurb.Bin236]HPI76266.1 cell division ATP-binding protein FtsE [bacterium]
MIDFKRVHLIYHKDKVHALKDVSLSFSKGEISFLVGPTGCGKSSLLKMVYMDIMPSRGSVRVLGKDTYDYSERQIAHLRRKVGVVFQDFRLLPTKTVYENVAYPLHVIGASDYEIERRVPQVVKLVGLEDKLDSLPGSLAKGQEQRVSIARAIVNDPLILLADEPTGNLDPDTSMEIIKLLLEIQTTRGTTILVASHDMETVKRSRKRIVRIENGIVVSDQQPGFAHCAESTEDVRGE